MQPYLIAAPTGRRYLFWITLGFLLGIAYAISFPIFPTSFPRFLKYSLLILGVLLILILILRHTNLSVRDMVVCWLILCFFLLGICRVYSFDNPKNNTLQESAGNSHQYTGIITGDPTLSNSEKSRGFPVKVLSRQVEDKDSVSCTGNIMLYAPLAMTNSLNYGDGISFICTLTQPEDGAFAGDFSIRQYLYRQNLRFMAYTDQVSSTRIDYTPTLKDKFLQFGNAIRSSILASIDKSFADNPEEKALLKGILLGVREDFSTEQYQSFVDSGLIHITAVSGMHVMFLSGFLLFLLRKLQIPRFLRNFILIPILILFAAVSAFTPSVCRATAMMILLIIAEWLFRDPDTLTSLSAAALLLLCINPYTITSYSFILSFSSVLGIIFFCPIFYHYLLMPFQNKNADKATKRKPKPFWRKYLLEPVCSSLALTAGGSIGVGFFLMRFFRRISLGGFPANICLLPFSAATFVLGFVHYPLSQICPPLGRFLAQVPLKGMLWCINKVASVFSHPIFRIETPMPPMSAILPYLGFCIALYFTIKPNCENNT